MNLLRWLCFRGILGLVAFAILAAPVYADGTPITINQVRATEFPSVTVRFTVSSSRGLPLPVLEAKNFAITEDGQPIRSLTAYSFYENPTPVDVVLAIDVSGSMDDEGKLVGAKSAAKTFIAQLRPICW